MNQAIVIGGSSGIGLAVSRVLIDRGMHVLVCARHAPDPDALPEDGYTFLPCDLRDPLTPAVCGLAADETVTSLIITAGFGRVAPLSAHTDSELRAMMDVNATGALRVLRLFYDRLHADTPFYACVIGSIAGLVSSPLLAPYAASKAALCRFVESVNIELEAERAVNRILCVAPGFVPGTRFYGGANEPLRVAPLAEEIVERMLARETLFIPRYEETYRAVLERYRDDPRAFGLESYAYKQASGRLSEKRKQCVGYLSGTFDLFHIGHLNLLRRAKEHCDYLIVGVHGSGAWKGKETFVPFDERKEIVAACRYVDRVVDSCVEDSDAWTLYHYDRLFVGSDYKGTERFERYEAFFADKGVEIVYFPYTRTTSSTQLRAAMTLKMRQAEPEGES